MKRIGVLFVCMGNICRSPTAEGVFRNMLKHKKLSDALNVDSAGTLAYHKGEPPDIRAQETARRRGIDLSTQRARPVTQADFAQFDYIVPMDLENMAELKRSCPPDKSSRLRLLCDYAPELNLREVPDPYYGGDQGFEHVFQIISTSSAGLLDTILKSHFPGHVHLG